MQGKPSFLVVTNKIFRQVAGKLQKKTAKNCKKTAKTAKKLQLALKFPLQGKFSMRIAYKTQILSMCICNYKCLTNMHFTPSFMHILACGWHLQCLEPQFQKYFWRKCGLFHRNFADLLKTLQNFLVFPEANLQGKPSF